MKRLICFTVGIFWSLSCFSAEAPKPVAGQDYQVIHAQSNQTAAAQDDQTVTVTEFFSYGCPWCYRIEPLLMNWVKHLPQHVVFNRVPVVFEQDWDVYAKAFYTAQSLHITDRLTQVLFEAIQDKHMTLTTPQAMAGFFTEQGVERRYAESAFLYSMTINAQVSEGMKLSRTYSVTNVPALVIAGRYRVDLAMTKGDVQRMFEIADYLINQVLPSDPQETAQSSDA